MIPFHHVEDRIGIKLLTRGEDKPMSSAVQAGYRDL